MWQWRSLEDENNNIINREVNQEIALYSSEEGPTTAELDRHVQKLKKLTKKQDNNNNHQRQHKKINTNRHHGQQLQPQYSVTKPPNIGSKTCSFSIMPSKYLRNFDRIFLIPGDYYINLDFRRDNSLEDQILQYQSLKRVSRAKKWDSQSLVVFDLTSQSSSEYQSFQIIEKAIICAQDPFLENFLPTISTYFTQLLEIEQNKNKAEIFPYNTNPLFRAYQDELMEKRRQYEDAIFDEYIADKFKDGEFYIYYKYAQNSPDKGYLEYRQTGVSYPLIALLGTDPSSFVNISMRNGFLEFSSSLYKQVQMLESMVCRMNPCNHSFQGQTAFECLLKDDVEATLLTFDGFEILTKINIINFSFSFPAELQNPSGIAALHNNAITLLKYNIDLNTLAMIIAKRQSAPCFKMQWENEIFGYTLESQVFLEKYYKDILEKKAAKEQEAQYQHKLKFYYNNQCGIKNCMKNENVSLDI